MQVSFTEVTYMKHLMLFFFRFDLIRKICRVFLIPLVIVCLLVKFSKLPYFLVVTVIVGVIAFSKKNVPTELNAAEELKRICDDIERRIIKQHPDWDVKSINRIDGISPGSMILMRNTGSRIMSPECITAVQYEKGGHNYIHAISYDVKNSAVGNEFSIDLSEHKDVRIISEQIKGGKYTKISLIKSGEKIHSLICYSGHFCNKFLNSLSQ